MTKLINFLKSFITTPGIPAPAFIGEVTLAKTTTATFTLTAEYPVEIDGWVYAVAHIKIKAFGKVAYLPTHARNEWETILSSVFTSEEINRLTA